MGESRGMRAHLRLHNVVFVRLRHVCDDFLRHQALVRIHDTRICSHSLVQFTESSGNLFPYSHNDDRSRYVHTIVVLTQQIRRDGVTPRPLVNVNP
jgi:hypothetical protein